MDAYPDLPRSNDCTETLRISKASKPPNLLRTIAFMKPVMILPFYALHRSRLQVDKAHCGDMTSAQCSFQFAVGMRAITLISKSKPASQLTPIAVQFG